MARRRTRSGLLRTTLGVALAPLLALAAAGAILITDQRGGLLTLARLADEVEGVHQHVRELQQERGELTVRIGRLRHEHFAIEVVAREQLGMVRPGELVVRWPQEALRAD